MKTEVVFQFESKHGLSVPENHGTERPLQNHFAFVCVAFVAAARFLGGQLLVSFANEIDLLPEFCEGCEFHFHALPTAKEWEENSHP